MAAVGIEDEDDDILTRKLLAMVPATARSDDLGQSTEIGRGRNLRGKQDDHATAFAVLKQLLRTTINESRPTSVGNRVHATPVLAMLLRIANQELEMLKVANLINPAQLLDEMKKLISIIDPKRLEQFDGTHTIIHNINIALQICTEFFKVKQNQSLGEFDSFLHLYSKIIPYKNLIDLIDALHQDLKTAKDRVEREATRLAQDAVDRFNQQIRKLDGVSSLPLETQRIIIKQMATAALRSVQDALAKATIEVSVNTYAHGLNILPFVTFKHTNCSGKSRHGDGAVSAAIDRLEVVCRKKPTDVAAMAKKVDEAAIYIALLLDFYPLTSTELTQQREEERKAIVGQIGTAQSVRLPTRAANLALTRNNDDQIFIYVVARHWQIMCDSFPALKNCDEKEQIKLKFIQHMLIRWKCADLKPEQRAPTHKR